MSSEGTNFFSRLPEDVSNLILLKLPIKSLLVCTSVCKTWNSLIKSPAFFSSHLHRTIASSEENDANLCLLQLCSLSIKTGRDCFFLRSKNQDFSVRERIYFPYKGKFGGFQVAASCNGLICLMQGKINVATLSRLILWNPIIRKSVIFNTFPKLTPLEAIGLGFDSRNGDYKLVTIIEELGNETTLMVNLYSLKSNSWKRLPDVEAKFDDKWMNVHRGMTYLNGALYFVARKTITRPTFVIWEFDLSEEVFHEVMLPDCMSNQTYGFYWRGFYHGSASFHLLTCGEALAVLWYGETIREIQVWVMKERGVGESWTQLSTIRLEGLGDPQSLQITGSVFTKDACVLFSLVSDENNVGRIFLHDLKSQETKEFINVAYYSCIFLGDYVESLALLDKGNDLSGDFEIESGDANDTCGNSSSSNANFLMGSSASSNVTGAWNAMDYLNENNIPLNQGIIVGLEEESDESDSSAGNSSEDSTIDLANSSSSHATL